MIGAGVFDGLDFGARSFRLRARRQAMANDAAIASGLYDEAPARSSVAPQSPTPSRGMPAASSAPRPASYRPASGSRVIVMPEEEQRRRRPVAAGGAGIVAARPILAVQSVGAVQEAYAVEVRSVEVKRAALALGSQAAVVKLASFANGRARVSALLTYQSHNGEEALEREDGSTVQGREAIQALVARWQEDAPAREPSKDVLSFTLTIDGEVSQRQAEAALAEVLAGHRYAFRIEEEGASSRLHVVMSAASSQRDEQGRAVRIFDNKKSLGALESRLSDSFEGATFQAQGFLHGVEGASISLLRLSKRGEQTVITSKGKVLTGEEAARSEAKSWKRDLRSTDQREVAHIIFSAKPGTDKAAFVDAVRATLDREFAGREYVFALHTNRQHIHVHAAVRMRDSHGKKMDPRIQDLQRWRETLAEEARQRNIPMEAVSRFEQANVPGYKLKDIRRVERGLAPESARRRVEAAQTRAIHIPTREEGRKRANEAARGWQAVAVARASGPEPTQAADTIRLYRAERPGANASSAPLFARDRATAETLAASFKGSVSYVDVPRSRLSEVTPSRTNPEAYVTVSRDLAARQQPLTPAPERRVLELRDRTRTAIERAEQQSETPTEQKGKPTMPTLERMESTIDSIKTNIDAMIEAAPEETRPNLEVWAVGAMQELEEAVAEKRKQADSRRPGIEGDRYVEPLPTTIQGFRSKARGTDIHFFRETPTGEKLAFVDNGRQVKIYDWKDRESVRAALQLSSEKWNGLVIKGNDEYKSMVVSLAAEHGFKITNPELQERIAAERQRLGKPEPVKETAEVREAAPQAQKPQGAPAQNPTSSAAAAEPKTETASKPEAPASKAEASPAARPEKDSAERPPMVGVLVKVGKGPYKDDPKNDVSQYVDLRTEDGRVHRIWSVQVAKDLKAADAKSGETVKAQYLGNEHVTKPVPVKDEKTGEVTHREEKSVERGVWRTEVVRQVQQEQPEGQAAAPETSANAEQQAQRQERDRAEDQRREQQRRQTQKPRNRP
ncbi:LPD7 domain-containing protein [Microvirga lotononidis]|uniref:Relaxase/mobilization nuclease n=1 Tax=Microvirga lotononidis TaxID=864069 RepID=I4Z252_9HYPH|nr:LPD7 domain-containing protein [Microvirga lotononidis]EIM30294.1 relaxase/mobilization nuclease [Microvirga lotononidis]WQO31139.1 LPD7 domain-containing protein [Microvirga lotononidis]